MVQITCRAACPLVFVCFHCNNNSLDLVLQEVACDVSPVAEGLNFVQGVAGVIKERIIKEHFLAVMTSLSTRCCVCAQKTFCSKYTVAQKGTERKNSLQPPLLDAIECRLKVKVVALRDDNMVAEMVVKCAPPMVWRGQPWSVVTGNRWIQMESWVLWSCGFSSVWTHQEF